MKLFGGGKPGKEEGKGGRDEEAGYFDSPTENVSLAAPPPKVVVMQAEEPPPRPSFGIDNAIQLMRSLPLDKNPELVVQVIKTTLESMRVKVADILKDAGAKLGDLEQRVELLSKEIKDYEKEIAQRKEQIQKLEADHAETSSVKSRLEQAEKGASSDKSQAKTGS